MTNKVHNSVLERGSIVHIYSAATPFLGGEGTGKSDLNG